MSLVALLSLTALGADVIVDPTGAGDHTTVGAAVAAANAGDRVVLEPGDYSGEAVVAIDKNLEILGNLGAAVTQAPRMAISSNADVVIRMVELSCVADDVTPAVLIDNATVELDQVQTNLCPVGDRIFVDAASSDLWIHDSDFDAGGLAVTALDVGLVVEDCTFAPTGDPGRGIELVQILDQSPVLIARTTFSGLEGYPGVYSGDSGMAVSVIGPAAAVTIEECVFRDNTSAGSGGAVAIGSTGSVWVLDSQFENNSGDEGGAIFANGADLRIERTSFLDNQGVTGAGAIHFTNNDASEHLTLEQVSSVRDTSSGEGGSVVFDAPGNLTVRSGWMCGNAAPSGGAALTIRGGAATLIEGTAIALTSGTDGVLHEGSTGLEVRNVTFAGPGEDAIRVEGLGTSVEVSESIFHDGPGLIGVVGVDTSGGANPLNGAGAYNNLFDFGALGASEFNTGTFGAYLTNLDPMFQSYGPTVDCDSINLWLDPASPLRDLGTGTDLDGTASDIGAFGGPWANLIDADNDLVYEDLDCNDADPAISPTVTEIPYDGIDQDCTGADLTDVDGDGHDGTVVGGDDCDDEDDAIYPGAPDAWYDGIDANCDGADDYDQDGDGHKAGSGGGDDCNDTDAGISPDAEEIPDDGIDQDCDGEDAKSPGSGTGTGTGTGGPTGGDGGASTGCGCSHSAPGAGWSILPFLLALGIRRRRAQVAVE